MVEVATHPRDVTAGGPANPGARVRGEASPVVVIQAVEVQAVTYPRSPHAAHSGAWASYDLVSDQIVQTAQRVFGHDSLRPGQYEAVRALLDGHDVLLVQPTGGGKSLAYQLPAVLIDGPTLVVSPLLALQEDQTTRLEEYGRRTVARRVSSAETKKERDQALVDAAAGPSGIPLPGSRAAGQRRGAGKP